jgi:hypothetical protein
MGVQIVRSKAGVDYPASFSRASVAYTPVRDIPVAWDYFNAPDGTNLNGRVSDSGHVWTVSVGSATISGNKVLVGGACRMFQDTGISDGKVSVVHGGIVSTGIIFRAVDTANFLVAIRSNAVGNPLKLFSFKNNVASELASADVPAMADGDIITVSAFGDQISVFLNGVLSLSHITSQYATATKAGLYNASGSTAATFDNFLVTRPDYGGQIVAAGRPRLVPGRFGQGVFVEEGTENLVPVDRQKFYGWTTYQGAQVAITQGIVVPEWGAVDATRIQTSGGSGSTKYYVVLVSPSASGQAYAGSMWVKNIGQATALFHLNIGSQVSVLPGESKQIFLSGIGNGVSNLNIEIEAENVSDSLDFIAWRPQVEAKSYATSFAITTRQRELLTIPTSVPDPARPDNLSLPYNPTDTSNWTSSGPGSTPVTYDTTEQAYYTTTNRKMVIPITPGKTYTLSLTLRHREAGEGGYYCLLNWGGSNHVFPASGVTDEYLRHSSTFTAMGSTLTVIVYSKIWFKGDLMLEEGSAASDWCPGGHRLILGPSVGTIEGWMYVNDALRASNVGNRSAYSIWYDTVKVSIGLYRSSTVGNWRFGVRSLYPADVTRVDIPDSEIPDGWRLIGIAWGSGESNLCVDGVQKASINLTPGMEGYFPNPLYIGSRPGGYFCNGVYDDIRISKIKRSAEEQLALYQSGQPAPWDEHTTAILRFDGRGRRIQVGGGGL